MTSPNWRIDASDEFPGERGYRVTCVRSNTTIGYLLKQDQIWRAYGVTIHGHHNPAVSAAYGEQTDAAEWCWIGWHEACLRLVDAFPELFRQKSAALHHLESSKRAVA